jgi:hypothetical protein
VVIYAYIFVYEATDADLVKLIQAIYATPRGKYDRIGEAGIRRHEDVPGSTPLLNIAGRQTSKPIYSGLVEVWLVVDCDATVFKAMYL